MGVTSLDSRVTDIISRLARAKHLSLVVGAGASVAAQLPGWEELIQRLLTGGRKKNATRIAELLTSTQGFLLAAEAAFPPNATAKKRKQKVFSALYGKGGPESLVPSELHQAVAQLAKVRSSQRLQVFTTNYDELLEQAFQDEGVPCQARFEARNPTHGSRIPIHHIHGLLGSKQQSADIVLGQSDYARITADQSDWPTEEFGTAASKGPVVFVGASLTDPNLLRILNRIKSREFERHVLVLARQGLEVPYDLRDDFLKRLVRQWEQYNVDVVLLEDFSDIALFVRELGAAEQPGYQPPIPRVQELWRAMEADFLEIQRSFAAALEENLQGRLQQFLGAEANLVLWLCDAHGSLVRFAANDRLHRSAAILRKIPNRHDSGWVVSEALAFDSTTVRDLKVSSGSEIRGPDHRWHRIAAVPLRPALGGRSPVIAGALSCASAQQNPKTDGELGETLAGELATEWELRLQQVLDDGRAPT